MSKCNPYRILKHFTYTNISRCENEPGVYSFWYAKKCIYVGKTEKQGIRDRLIQHWNGSHNERLRSWIDAKKNEIKFCTKTIPLKNVDIAERYFIHKYQPVTNVQLSYAEFNTEINIEKEICNVNGDAS